MERGGIWMCWCPDDKPNRQTYEKDGVTHYICCNNGLYAVEQDDGTWACGCPETHSNYQTYEKDGVTHHLCCQKWEFIVERNGIMECGCPAETHVLVEDNDVVHTGNVGDVGNVCCSIDEWILT